MLPPGHVAGGYLVAVTLTGLISPVLSEQETGLLIAIGMFFGFAPDLDMFISFLRKGEARLGQGEHNHRYLITHTPIFWLFVGTLTALLIPQPLGWHVGAMMFFGALSHLALDSIQFGIMWVFPFTRRLFALRDSGVEFHLSQDKGFLAHWGEMVAMYARRFTLTFVCEILVIAAALIVFAAP